MPYMIDKKTGNKTIINVPNTQEPSVPVQPTARVPQQNILQKILGFVAPATTRAVENQYSTVKQAQDKFYGGGGFGNYLKDVLPTFNPLSADKLKSGAEMASYLIPFGKGANIASKFLIPGAAVGLSQGLSKEEVTPTSLGVDTALGAGGAGVLGLLGRAVPGIGKLFSKGGESLATKTLRPSPSQQIKFFKETGEKLGGYLQKKGLQGANYEKISSFVEPLQNQFDEVVTNQGLKVKAGSVFSDLTKKAQELLKSTIPSDKAKGQVIKTIAKNFQNTYGDKALGADIVTTLRKQVDDNVKDFALDEATKGPLNIYRDSLQKSIRDVADKVGVTIGDKTLKETGVELSKLYKVLGIAEKQQFLGGGANPLGLTGLLGAGVGGGLGGLPGAAAGVLATKAINSPQVIGAASKGATALGSGLGTATINPLLKQILGQVSSRGGGLIPSGPTNQRENYNQDSQIAPSPERIAQPVNTNQISEDQMRQVLMSNKISDKTKKNILAAYKLQDTGQGKPKSATAQNLINLGNAGLRSLQTVRDIVENDPSVLAKQLIPGKFFSRKFDSAIAHTVESLLRARSGAAVPKEEVKKYTEKFGPMLGDSKEVIRYKLDALERDLLDMVNVSNKTLGIDDIKNLFSEMGGE